MSGKRLGSGDTFVVDFDPLCPCGNHATHLLTMHRVDYCTPEEPNETEFKCQACLAKAYILAAKLLHPGNGMNWCSSCGLTLDRQCTIIVTLWPIPREGKGSV